ncbi:MULTISPECIES: hypothetical protein [unclassified Streptomyces]|uniref:hypothetical protein n=1 Tax=unclassified Streptomyces TaxID=2593676 RepID=UPI001BEA9D67|nr:MULTISPECIES: hypothetical protein [unclassified Streptomyces]MBT2406970.1 hypothetical protein [Streptomyces sp. ISL-21]MBT2455992.1 hypothetical protein [Streptomyces sp. ISL-86]MBT2610598.1 hypothetical protein [Streptomyces sp. ISL-87]
MSGSLWLKVPGGNTLPAVPRPRRTAPPAADPMDELADRLGGFIAAAVHPDEIAAILESDGMTDEHIRLTYGRPDSFGLAEELYDRVPRSFPEPEGAPDPWKVSLTACLLRGVIFALPGLAYLLGAPLLEGPQDRLGLPAGTLTLLAGALIGWVWDQTLSHRAYSWLGLGDRAAAGRILLVGAPAGALLGTAAALSVPGGPPFSYAFAAGQASYVGAATVLLVLGRERVLLAALAPMAAGAVLVLFTDLPVPVRVTLLVVSLLAACTLAVRELPLAEGVRAAVRRIRGWAGRRPGEGPVRWRMLRGAEEEYAPRGPRLADSVPYGVFGLGTGLLVLYAALGEVLAGGPAEAVAAPSAVALTLSMGPAEWLLHRFRSGSLAGLRSARSPRAFRRRMLATLVRCLAVYLAVLLALGLAGTLLWPGAPGLTGIRAATLLLLGAVMWTGLLLQSFGAVRPAAAVCASAAVAQSLALLTGLGQPRLVQLVVAGTAAAALATLVCLLLGRATAHR